MREHLHKFVIVALMLLVVGVPFAMQPTAGTDRVPVADSAHRLIIVTPHNEQIRHEMARGFNAWRSSQGLGPVAFDWRSSAGTSDLRKQVLTQLAAAAEQGLEDEGIGLDLFFGGGEYDHNKLAAGIRIERGGETRTLSVSVPPNLPQGLINQAFPEPVLGGERLYHPELYWVGSALSSFGIVYNRDVLAMLELPEPADWADLQDGRYRGWLALADPGHSGSIAATYNVILRRTGWTEGWGLLRRVFANGRYFTTSSSNVPVDVSSGNAAAGMCIDFYGRFQAGAIGGDRVGYVDPAFRTATTADPISLIRGAPHRELAEQFIAWLLTPGAQALWQRRLGTEGGPGAYELRRQPILREVYTPAERAKWTDPQIDPFATSRPFPEAMPDFFATVAPLTRAMAIDIHDDLAAAWRTILRTPETDPRRAEMLRLFDAMPEELTLTWPSDAVAAQWREALASTEHPLHGEAAAALAAFRERLADRYFGRSGADALLAARLRWTVFFRENYRRIVRLGETIPANGG